MNRHVSLMMPFDVVRMIDGLAQRERRSRSSMVTYLLCCHPVLKDALARIQEAEEENRRSIRQARQEAEGLSRRG